MNGLFCFLAASLQKTYTTLLIQARRKLYVTWTPLLQGSRKLKNTQSWERNEMYRAATLPVRDVYPDTVTVLGSKIPTEEIREEWEKTSGSIAITFPPQKPCRWLSISVQQQHHRALHGWTGVPDTRGSHPVPDTRGFPTQGGPIPSLTGPALRSDFPALSPATLVHLQFVRKTITLNAIPSAHPTANDHFAMKMIHLLLFV